MKYIKTYETVNKTKKPIIGDYVLCLDQSDDNDLNDFLSNNIGQYIAPFGSDEFPYEIEYTDIPRDLYGAFSVDGEDGNNLGTRQFSLKEIKYWSKDKKNLELIITTNKYNI